MLLSCRAILRHLEYGSIVISPFEKASLNTTSYDARLGPWYFREQSDRVGTAVFNPLDADHVDRLWGNVERAVSAQIWMAENQQLKNITDQDYLIVIKPGETILAHTIEFIGGRDVQISPDLPISWMNATTEMRARSSIGRVGITVCKCAGWGDVGYIGRWTMEITNMMRETIVCLPAGMRVCQLIFYQVDQTLTSYAKESGKYQENDDLEQLQQAWKPEMMLPRLYQDRDIGTFHERIPDDFFVNIESQ